MKRNFLLMLLLTLLPFVGWAQDVTAPEGISANYTGVAQYLIKTPAEVSEDYTVEYSMDEENWFSEESAQNEDAFSKTEAGVYTIYYQVKDESGEDVVDGGSFTATISKATNELTNEPEGLSAFATGEPQSLVVVSATAKFGDVVYALTENAATWTSAAELTGTEIGTYTVYYKVVETDNYEGLTGSFTAKINDKVEIFITPATITQTYGDPDKGTAFGGYDETNPNGVSVSMFYVEETPGLPVGVTKEDVAQCLKAKRAINNEGTNAGIYQYTFATDLTLNVHVAAAVKKISIIRNGDLNINKAAITYNGVPVATSDLIYNGNDQELVTIPTGDDAVIEEGMTLEEIAAAHENANEYFINGGEWQFSVVIPATGTTPASATDYSSDIPTGLNAGTYEIWCKAVATDNNHEDGDPFPISGSIAKATPVLAGPISLTDDVTFTEVTGQNYAYTTTYDPELIINGSGVTVTTTPAINASRPQPTVKYYYQELQGNNNWSTAAEIVTVDDPNTPADERTFFQANTGNNRYYRIFAYVEADENGNWDAVNGHNVNATADEPVETSVRVLKANITTPVAVSDLVYNGKEQKLIVDPQNTSIWFSFVQNQPNQYSPNIPTRTDAGTYRVYYAVSSDRNYNNAFGQIDVTIAKSLLAIKVNNVTKVYDATNTVTQNNTELATGVTERFTLLNETFNNDAEQIRGVNYAPMAEGTGITVAGSPYGITVTKEALTARNANYDYEVIPGELTVAPAEIYVQTERYSGTGASRIDYYQMVYGTTPVVDFSRAYTVHGLQGEDTAEDAFETLPVLTAPDALPADNPEVGEYDLVFTAGTLKENGNYVMRPETDTQKPYVIWSMTYGGQTYTDQFTVVPEADSRIVITIIPQKAEYNYGEAPELNMTPGVGYYLTGLQGDDTAETVFTTAPTFTLEEAADEEAGYVPGTYALTYNEDAVLANPTRYAGGIKFINGTMEITKRILTGDVAAQMIITDDDFKDDAFKIYDGENVVDAEKLELNAELTINPEVSRDVPGEYPNGILLSIESENFTLEEGTQYGTLIILDNEILVLEDGKSKDRIEAADGRTMDVQIDGRTLKANSWNVMVLPFDITTLEFCNAIGCYAAFNVLDRVEGNEVTDVKFALELEQLKANEPFLVKPIKTVEFIAGNDGIIFESVDVENATPTKTVTGGGAQCDFIGTYETMTITDNPFYALQGGKFKKFTTAMELGFTRAYITLGDEVTEVRFFIEELNSDGTTAIKQLNADTLESNASEGWYTVDGKKLNAAPVQKGVYIQNGKKVLVK